MKINNIFAKDGSIKSKIRIAINSKINFRRKAIKEAIPNFVKSLKGMKVKEERLEILNDKYPDYYFYIFKKFR